MLDIIFISYDEPNADKNFQALKLRFPHAKRVHGVKGIANAHIAASKKSTTSMFYVVDGDAEILPSFDFSYVPPEHDREYVHIWYAQNPVIGLSYGYGGVKLFNKKFFRNIKSQLDFSTTLTKDIKIIEQPACITRFNSDEIRAFRGAFRESAKLSRIVNDTSVSKQMRDEASIRLSAWLHPRNNVEFSEHIAAGAAEGVKQSNAQPDIMFINDHDVMSKISTDFLMDSFSIDSSTDPTPPPSDEISSELIFTTTIAAACYDPFVIDNLPLTELRDAISDGQLLSKSWLVDQFKKLRTTGKISKDGKLKIAISGGWIGTLALMFFIKECDVEITSLDIDDRANRIAEVINFRHDFKTKAVDMYDFDYSDFDVIINTSSEHIPDISTWRKSLPAGKILIVQNNNFVDCDGHISTVNDSRELRAKLDLAEVFYEGTRKFPMYSRFMVIGKT